MTNVESLLKIQGLHVNLMTTGGIVYAVQGVNLDVRRGEFLGLVGESGCGKSMTVKSIMRLHDEKRTEYEGVILYEGQNILTMNRRAIRSLSGKDISMIFQDPMSSLNPIMKAGEQIAELIREKEHLDKKAAKARALEMLELVGVLPAEDRYEQYPFEMSGGMAQRVMIAIAMACHPKLLLADEPTTALDVTIQAQILDLMKSLQKEYETTTVIVTHNLGVVAEICDRVAVMYAGRIVETASVEEIFDNPVHPYTRALMASRPKEGDKTMTFIPGSPPGLSQEFRFCPFASRCGYCMEKCRTAMPDTVKVGHGHLVNCHLAKKGG